MKKFLQKPFKYSLTKNILLIIGILVVGYVIINLFLRIITRHNQELTVPDMTGMNLAEASAVAAEADLRLEVTDSVYIRGMERGAIARQNPEPGGKVKKNRRILLVINSVIPRQSTMPSLTGFSLRQARTELASNGLNIGKLIYVNDMATDNVLAQQYMGEELLHDNSLNIYRCEFDTTVTDYADSLEAYVYGQYPPASDSISVRRGTSVTLYLSKDVSRIPVPEEETDSTDVQL